MTTEKPGLKERFWEEMRIYGALTVYLFACFSVILVYKASILGQFESSPVRFSMALVQALVIGKFILIGKVMGVGERKVSSHLLHRVAFRTLAYTVLLIVFKFLEELVVGWVHGHSTGEVWAELMEKDLLGFAAPILVMIMFLIPLTAFVELERALGSDKLRGVIRGGDHSES